MIILIFAVMMKVNNKGYLNFVFFSGGKYMNRVC